MTPCFRSAPLLAALLACALCAPAVAQRAAAGPGPAPTFGEAVFRGPLAAPLNPGGNYIPPDAGGPVGPDDNDGAGDGSPTPGSSVDPGTRAAGPRGQGSGVAPATRASTRAVGAGGTVRSGTTGLVDTLPDRWEAWWETNKFDFIELRRVEDPPRTGQGEQRETPEERELRLASIRATIRRDVVPVLRSLTSSDDPAVRAAAAVSLGKLRDRESYDMIAARLADGSFMVRRAAMLALGVLDFGRASYLLLNVAGDTPAGRAAVGTEILSPGDRGVALLTLSLRGGDAAEDLLVSLFADRADQDLTLLAMACDAAGLTGASRTIGPLIEIACDEGLPEYVRSAATSALGRIGDPSVAPALLDLLDTGLQPRRAAVIALGLVGHPGAVVVIERLAKVLATDSDAPARHFAAISLGRIGGPVAHAHLAGRFRGASGDMRPWIALGLGLCADDDPEGATPERLVEALAEERNADTRAAYAVALGLCRTGVGLDTLADLLESRNPNLAGYAAVGLGLSHQPAAAPLLRSIIERSDQPELRRQAALGMGILGDSASIGTLLDVIRETRNPFVASFSAIGIAFMGDAEAAGPLLHLIEREGPRGVRTTWATAAVGQLFDSDRRPALSRLAAGDNFHAWVQPVSDLLDLGF